jgi:hypothetical protein
MPTADILFVEANVMCPGAEIESTGRGVFRFRITVRNPEGVEHLRGNRDPQIQVNGRPTIAHGLHDSGGLVEATFLFRVHAVTVETRMSS